MRSISMAVVLGLAFALAGCPKKTSGAAGDGGVATSASANPVNADDITRYPDEKKLDSEPGTLARDGVIVHKSPPDGATVTTLPNGTNVVKIAQSHTNFLVTFDDPTSNQRMMGWITEDSFSPAPAAPSGPKWTPPAKKADAGVAADAGGGGGTATVDAGGGGGGGGTATADAGGGGGGGAATTGPIVPPGAGNSCGANYTFAADDKMCHMKCTRGPECGNKRCKSGLCR